MAIQSSCESAGPTFRGVAAQEAPEVTKGGVGDVLVVNVDTHALLAQEVREIDCPRTRSIACIPDIPAWRKGRPLLLIFALTTYFAM